MKLISRFYFCFNFRFVLFMLSFSRDDWMTIILLLKLKKKNCDKCCVYNRLWSRYSLGRKWNASRPTILRHDSYKSTWIIALCTARRVSRSKRVARLANFDQQRASLEQLNFDCTLAALSGAFQSFFD